MSHLPETERCGEKVATIAALDRILAEDVIAPHPLPEFRRSTVDGYALRARDTFGASDASPAYLGMVGEVPMGARPADPVAGGLCALIHTGGMLPEGADAVLMLEHAQASRAGEIEALRAVAVGENVIAVGEDVEAGELVLPCGSRLRPAEIGGLMALGLLEVTVVRKGRVGLISSGDEVVDPAQQPAPGQVRDVNSYSLAALVRGAGAEAVQFGVVSDTFEALHSVAAQALAACDIVVITAGSSASTRDLTADVISALGEPGVLVHGINTRPGKPTILGVCAGKAVIGLPGNPVSALVNGVLFVVPVIERLAGARPRPPGKVLAKLSVNLASQAGREDWWPVRLVPAVSKPSAKAAIAVRYVAEPVFGRSNLIFNLAAADGLLRIPEPATGLDQGEIVEVMLL